MANLAQQLEIINLSHTGRKRQHNEDSTFADPGNGLLILADGIGGYMAGEIASSLAVVEIRQYVLDALKSPAGNTDNSGYSEHSIMLKKAISHANETIHALAQQEKNCKNMGTTVVACLFHSSLLSIAHVGDSRAYLFKNNELRQLTEDHSVHQAMLDRGGSAEDVKNVPKNLVTRALGIKATVGIDLVELSFQHGDTLLVCSDGLSDMVEFEKIHSVMEQYIRNLEQCGETLVYLANKHGGVDNISVILCQMCNA